MQNPQSPRPKPDYWQYLYLLILVPCLVYTVFYTTRAIRLDYTAAPMWDSWRSVQHLDELFRFDLKFFWIQHNEHRIVFPEVIYAFDYIFLRGVQLLPIACNIAFQILQIVLLCWLIWRMIDLPLAFRLILAVSATLIMTSAMQVQGLLGTFELQWYLSDTAAVLAIFALWITSRTGRPASLATSIAGAVIATYSTGNGMMIWPVMIAAAVLLRLSKKRVIIIAVAGSVSIVTYFIGYSFTNPGRIGVLLAHPLYAIWFIGVFLATPVSYLNVQWGGILGLTGLLLSLLVIAIAFRQRRLRDMSFLAAGVCMYTAAGALIIAYGRMIPTDPKVAAALPTRYVSMPLTWCAYMVVVIGCLVVQLPRARTAAIHVAATTLTMLLLVSIVNRQSSAERVFAMQQAVGEESGIALTAGIHDDDLIRAIFPQPPLVYRVIPAIQQRRLSIYTAGRQDWLGQPLNGVFIPAPTDRAGARCSGTMESIAPVTGGYRATGWAWDRGTDRPPKDIVLASNGVIIGFGETRPGGYPRNDPAQRPPADWDWVAFGRSAQVTGNIQAYAIVHGGQMACALGSSLPAPRVKPIPANQVGPPIHIASWKADPAWTLNGYHASVGTLPNEVLYGSYSGSDANQGVLTSAPFSVAGHGCIAIAAAHGPSVGGLSIHLVEPDTGKIVQFIPLSETAGLWQFWQIDLQGIDQLQIVAEDKGGDWGQWVAVSEPHWCRQ